MAENYTVGTKTRQKIIKESCRLFYKNGYQQTTYNDISNAAGINRALIPYHFSGKQALGQLLLEGIHTDYIAQFDAVIEASQYIPEFINIMHTYAYCYLLTFDKYCSFADAILSDPACDAFALFDLEGYVQHFAEKTVDFTPEQVSLLLNIVCGIRKQSVHAAAEQKSLSDYKLLARTELQMIMGYLGYSRKKTAELLDGADGLMDQLLITMHSSFRIDITVS